MIFAVSLLVGALALLTGCERKSIRDVLADPQRYADREVTIVGEVVDSYSVLGKGAYRVDDGTGKLWVVSVHGVPRRGSRVGVQGSVKDGFDLGSMVRLPEPFQEGLVLVATRHKAK